MHGPLDRSKAEPEQHSLTSCEKNQRSAGRSTEIFMHRPPDQCSSCDLVLHTQDFSVPGNPNTLQLEEDPSLHARNRRKAFSA
ncbi:hypothetical protein NDU88_007842 [Pleurodeles waltl]|uniref:Uncharacterized protein n=1 Tax=Pleurodeles waltl TaxID=8319 RepID=A0AAV7PQH4_PLEWA|nr:hypothetical protein NDU88_007842 [Pleurodeles waltl]